MWDALRYTPVGDTPPFLLGLDLLLLMLCTWSFTRWGPVRRLLSEGSASDVSSPLLLISADLNGSAAIITPARRCDLSGRFKNRMKEDGAAPRRQPRCRVRRLDRRDPAQARWSSASPTDRAPGLPTPVAGYGRRGGAGEWRRTRLWRSHKCCLSAKLSGGKVVRHSQISQWITLLKVKWLF